MGNIMEEAFTAYTGSEKVFTLNGKELVIPARFDAFITYRTKFMKLPKHVRIKRPRSIKKKSMTSTHSELYSKTFIWKI